MMRKKPLLCFVLAMLVSVASQASAQQRSKIARIGILRVDEPISPVGKEAIADLIRGLNSLGYAEGQNIEFDIRWAENKLDRLPKIAAELVQLNPRRNRHRRTSGAQNIKKRNEYCSNRDGSHG